MKSFFFSCCNLECRHLILRRVTQPVRQARVVVKLFQLRHFTRMGKTIHNLTLKRENSNRNWGFRIIGGKDEGQTFKVSNFHSVWIFIKQFYYFRLKKCWQDILLIMPEWKSMIFWLVLMVKKSLQWTMRKLWVWSKIPETQ